MRTDGPRELCRVIGETFPLPRRFRARLPAGVAELSRLLTRARPERGADYLNRPELLSAYLRYFLPWNVFRLVRLFEGIPSDPSGAPLFPAAAVPGGAGEALTVIDLGSGPLTLPIALWAAFPALRRRKLEFRCVDRSGPALDAGRKLFEAFRKVPDKEALPPDPDAPSPDKGAEAGPWNIKLIRGALDAPLRGGPARLVSALNVFNETGYAPAYAGAAGAGKAAAGADAAAALLDRLCSGDGAVFVMEPGVPRSAAFIAALRSALIGRGRNIAAPCTHGGPCPMPGGNARGLKAKWCHFAHGTADAPPELLRLSEAARVPKERAVFSYLLTGRAAPDAPEDAPRVRAVSGAFPVPAEDGGGGGRGRYGCCGRGLVLLTGSRADIDAAAPGALLASVPLTGRRDGKSGALAARLSRPASPSLSPGP